jgi:beta-galactosidase/beta-glucuronidase
VDRAALSAPLPRERRERRASLDGSWLVELEPGGEAKPIEVPFTFEAPLSGLGLGAEVHERIRYRRSFRVPDAWRGEHVLLRFAGVDWQATVRVDGRDVGRHRGGYTHFSFDLGPLDPGLEHEVEVDVYDPADGPQPRGKQRGSGGIWYTRATGIWRTVWLEAVPPAHIETFDLQARADGRLSVGATTSAATEVRVRVGDVDVPVPPGGTTIDVPGAPLWSPESPELVDVTLSTASGDVVHSYVAFRTVERRGHRLLLNGEPRFLCGVLDQAYWPDGIYTAPSADALRADVEAVKRLGFDLARMHVKVADPRWYAWCDVLGVLVAQDVPSPLRLDTEEARSDFLHEVEEIVAQVGGHPCVVLWIAFNEDWGEPPADFQRHVTERIRQIDPSRLVVDASGWHHRGDGDLVDVHDYGDDLARHEPAGDLPVWVGECGGVSLVVAGDEDFAYKHVADGASLASAYADHVATLGNVAGFVWTQLTDVEGELNGLLGHDRAPKVAPEAIRRVNDAARAARRQR